MEAPTRAGLPGKPFACHVTAFPQNETHHSSTSIFTAGANPPFLNSPTACVLPAFTSPSGNHPPVPPPRTYSSNSAKALPVDSANIARVASSSGLTHEQWREACEEDWASDLLGGDPKEGLTLEGLVISLFVADYST